MAGTRIRVTLDRDILSALDGWVNSGMFPNRSRAVEAVLRKKIRIERGPTRGRGEPRFRQLVEAGLRDIEAGRVLTATQARKTILARRRARGQ